MTQNLINQYYYYYEISQIINLEYKLFVIKRLLLNY